MSTSTPPALVPGAPRALLPFGIFSVLDWRTEGSAHWQGGGTLHEYLDPFTTDTLGPTQNPQSATAGLPKDLGRPADSGEETDAGFTGSDVFTVYGHFTVSPIAWSPEDAQARATAVLQAFEERDVERTFWTGEMGNNPNLQADTTNVGSFAAGSINYAIGALESFIGDTYGSVGVIHMRREYALAGVQNGTIKVVGTRMFTALGTPVVAGSGYPVGDIRATPALFGYRSDIFTSSARRGDLLDKGSNDLYAIAERTYLIGFDPTGVGVATITS